MHLRNYRLIAALLLLLCLSSSTAANPGAAVTNKFEPETLNYKVMFKWGLINKQAGHARLALTHDSRHYHAQLAASSEPWADKFFKVRDTLNGRMTYADFTPLFYEKIAHEGKDHKHDVVTYDYSVPGKVSAKCTRKVITKGKPKIDEVREMESDGAAVDMLTSFYYMRTLPFNEWIPGQTQRIDIFSGKRKELLSITYNGTENVDLDGRRLPSYHITFTFTSKGGAKTSDDMEAWIAADESRIPLRMEGNLPVGKVRCFFTGKGASPAKK